MACSEISSCRPTATLEPMKLPEAPPPRLEILLKEELATIQRRLDQLQSIAKPNLQPFMEQIDRLMEGQLLIQKSMATMQESIGALKMNAKESPTGRMGGDDLLLSNTRRSEKTRNATELKRIFVVDKDQREKAEQLKRISMCRRFLGDKAMEIDALDTFAAITILANTAFMGIRLDVDNDELDRNTWIFIDGAFTVAFVLELMVRVLIKGYREQFCGEEKIPRLFDACLIVGDLAQLCFDIFAEETFGGDISISLFRVLRLSRFVRVIRLAHLTTFKDLLAMLQGIVGGARTLAWAAFLFLLVTYLAALCCREAFGRQDVENIKEYFNTVPRSMYTVFRCSFGDCSTAGGVPIFEHVTETYGGVYGLLYCIFVFAITIGFFNVISAIFVDGAMSVAAELNARKQQERLSSETRKAVNVATIIKQVLSAAGKTTKDYSSDADIEVDRKILDQVASEEPHIQDPLVVRALDELDIDPHDHAKLSDILDPDHGGTIAVHDLVSGLLALRGQPRRSDIVCVNLMIRSLQERMEDLFEKLK